MAKITKEHNPIILASEPYVMKNNRIPAVHSDLVSFYKKGHTKPRAAIILHKQLANKCWELAQFTTTDQVAVKLKIKGLEVILFSTYMCAKNESPPPDVEKVIKYTQKHKLPLIMGTDSNSHHYLWGDKNTDKRGEDLLDFLDTHNLGWENRGSTPTFVNTRGHNSIIDLTITNNSGSKLIKNWKISGEESNSDHRHLQFNIKTDQTTTIEASRNVKNTDWDRFTESLASCQTLENLKTAPITTTEEIDHVASLLGDPYPPINERHAK